VIRKSIKGFCPVRPIRESRTFSTSYSNSSPTTSGGGGRGHRWLGNAGLV
jgi:hypothetical protein